MSDKSQTDIEWEFHIANEKGITFVGVVDKQKKTFLTVDEVVSLWRSSRSFCRDWGKLFTKVSFPSFFWECVPFSNKTKKKQRFECAFVSAPPLERVSPNPESFSSHFPPDGKKCEGVVCFSNLRGDARLVVPCPVGQKNFAHIRKFHENASEFQIEEFWNSVGESVHRRFFEIERETPIWLSTSGLGVYWLHVRLDSFPKYYSYAPYRNFSGDGE